MNQELPHLIDANIYLTEINHHIICKYKYIKNIIYSAIIKVNEISYMYNELKEINFVNLAIPDMPQIISITINPQDLSYIKFDSSSELIAITYSTNTMQILFANCVITYNSLTDIAVYISESQNNSNVPIDKFKIVTNVYCLKTFQFIQNQTNISLNFQNDIITSGYIYNYCEFKYIKIFIENATIKIAVPWNFKDVPLGTIIGFIDNPIDETIDQIETIETGYKKILIYQNKTAKIDYTNGEFMPHNPNGPAIKIYFKVYNQMLRMNESKYPLSREEFGLINEYNHKTQTTSSPEEPKNSVIFKGNEHIGMLYYINNFPVDPKIFEI